ncbi:zinc-binding alcohol dehydrogenase family protein [Arthrobacter echini]|uniref:Zinc-binding alcohol dehydrogenase family protein n=1 Tax=Arthrobacter echini TaxID=1529066 RepID=A0A4V3Z5N1_9MICC|nr:zinc-binding alcohol dehydrogenase family protein [Arthrobacter echini]THJ66959.1 zinc-binding alcohol dehydrogenase family protein [Arthrobacter echini]
MRAWRFEEFGGPEVLHLGTVDTPQAGAGEVLVRVEATGLNPMDLANLQGAFGGQLPRTAGRDFAGTVAGGDLDGVAVWGTPQGFAADRDGSLAEYVTVPADWVARRPRSLSPAQAAAHGIPTLTAWEAIVSIGRVQPGERVLITGVTGAVGRMAAQVAAWSGARVIGASRHSGSPVRGVHDMLHLDAADLADAVQDVTEGRGADLVLDTVGGDFFAPSVQAQANPGRQVAMFSAEPTVSFDLAEFFHGRRRLIGLDTLQLTGVETAHALTQAGRGFDSGALEPLDVDEWSFDDAGEALAVLASPPDGRPAGRQVIVL